MCFSLSIKIQCKSLFLAIPRSTHLDLSRSESSWTQSPNCTPSFRCIIDIEKCDEDCLGRGLPVSGDKDISERSEKAMSKDLERNVKIDWCDACERWNEEREEKEKQEQEKWNQGWKERVRRAPKGKGKEGEEEEKVRDQEEEEKRKMEWERMRVKREEEARALRMARDKDRDWVARWGIE